MNMDVSAFLASKENSSSSGATGPQTSPNHQIFKRSLASGLFGTDAPSVSRASGNGIAAKGHRVLAFKQKAPDAPEGYHQSIKVLYSQTQQQKRMVHTTRHIPSAPERVLDAPDLVDDYYLNLLDWNSSNVLAVALHGAVYLWNASTGAIDELMQLEEEESYVSSVKWVKEGSSVHLAVATSDAEVQLWDTSKMSRVRTMRGHRARIGSLSWNRHILSSGSRDTSIFNHDVRVADHHVASLVGHKQEVCGLAWSPDGHTLASGGNDNLLCLWDARRSASAHGAGAGARAGASTHTQEARCTLGAHLAAVKALAWCPFQRNVLASGGGTADKCIKFWNAGNGACLNSVDTGSQVCSLLWSPHEKELVSSHGFSDNQLCLWRYPSMQKITELKGHTARVLHLCASPDGATVCSAGADETLRFWNIFGGRDRKRSKKANGSRMFGGMALR
jgi:cell division cycle protein 20 (cofactor of APC complex)